MALPENPFKRAVFRTSTSLLASLSSLVLGVYRAGLKVETEGEENVLLLEAKGQNYILACWHTFVDAALFALHSRDLLIYSDHARTQRYMRSTAHFTREIGIKALEASGFSVLDASRGKQSVGIRNFIRRIQDGEPALVAPDGPHGPIYRAKPGVLYMAAKAQSVVIPVGFACSRRVVGRNWDDFELPLPFSRTVAVFGEPIVPPVKPTTESLVASAQALEDSLDTLSFRANELLFGKPAPRSERPPEGAAEDAGA